jgi:hypothetical protein
MKKRVVFSALFGVALSLATTGCPQITDEVPAKPARAFTLDRETYTRYDSATTVFTQAEPLTVTITNTGRNELKNLPLVLKGSGNGDHQDFSLSAASIDSLAVGESKTFQILFPANPPAGFLYKIKVVAGDAALSKELSINYGLYRLTSTQVDFDPAVLQAGGPDALVSTNDADKTGERPWFSSNPGVAFMADGKLRLTGAGSTIVGFITDQESLAIKGKAVTVYPAVEDLPPAYPLVEGILAGPVGHTAFLLNQTEIQDAAAGAGIRFSYTGGAGVISAIDENTGSLTFTGANGAQAKTTVEFTITKPMPEGSLTTHKGRIDFTAKIGEAPAVWVVSAATENEPADYSANAITLVFSDMISATDPAAGFTITKNDPPVSLVIQSAAVNSNRITFALTTPVFAGDCVTISYSGGTVSGGGRALDAFTLPVHSRMVSGPVLISAEINGAPEAAANKLVLQYDKAPVASEFSGFSITGHAESAGAFAITGIAANAADKTLTLTLNRRPAWSEIGAGGLALVYNIASLNVQDEEGHPGPGGAIPIALTGFDASYQPPEPQSVEIKAAAATTLEITFDIPVAAASAAGFSITGSQTASALTGIAGGSGTALLKLNLNLKPAFGETLTLTYNAAQGNVKNKDNADAVAASFSLPVTLSGFTAENSSRPAVQSVVIDAGTPGNTENAKKLKVTFDKAVSAANANGFSVSGSTTAQQISSVSGSNTAILTFTLNDWPSLSEAGSFTLSYNQSLGSVKDADNNLLPGFSSHAIDLTGDFSAIGNSGENVDTTKPWVISAVVEHSSPNIVRVQFSEPVTVTANQFQVKVNDWPRVNLATAFSSGNTLPSMDLDGMVVRTISAAAAVSGSNDTEYDLTMSASAGHGEILRLATTAVGAAQDKTTLPEKNKLPQIPQFIIRNNVRRTRESFENQAGLYRNGAPDATVTDGSGGQMYKNALAKLGGNTASDPLHPQAGEIITIVLESDQTLDTAPPWSSSSNATDLQGNANGAKVIITRKTGMTAPVTITLKNTRTGFYSRNNIALIIDEGIIFTHENAALASPVTTTNPLICVLGGGKLILDGGILEGHVMTSMPNDGSGGGILMGGGTYGSYVIMNSGEIRNNTVKTSSTANTDSGAGAVYIKQFGTFVMHGGKITNNKVEQTGAAGSVRAGGIAVCVKGNSLNNYHANAQIFMTGGEISGNQVTGGSGAVGSSGGVYTNGTFMKVGGTIYGEDGDASRRNSTSMTGNVKAAAVAVIKTAVINPAAVDAFQRKTNSGPAQTLFVDSFKTSASTAGTNTEPEWAESFWE